VTDDLVKRLREVKDWWREPGRTAEQAADRIEKLSRLFDITVNLNSDLTEKIRQQKDRIEKLEATLREIASGKYSNVVFTTYPPQDPAVVKARLALGEKKDD